MDSIKNYQRNCDKWKSLHEETIKKEKEFDKKIWDVKDQYRDQISEIKRKMYSEVQEVEEEKKNTIKEMKKEAKIIGDELHQAREIFKYINLYVQGMKVITPEVYYYYNGNHVPYEALTSIREDKYCNIYLYITGNDKPTNIYSLLVVGSCPVLEPDRDTRNPLHSYGVKAHTEEHTEIIFSIKDDYSVKRLQEYVHNNMKRILKKLSIIDEKIALYEQAVEAFKSTEGKVAYYQWRKYY